MWEGETCFYVCTLASPMPSSLPTFGDDLYLRLIMFFLLVFPGGRGAPRSRAFCPPISKTEKQQKTQKVSRPNFICSCMFLFCASRGGWMGGSREPWNDGPCPFPDLVTVVSFVVFSFAFSCCLCLEEGGTKINKKHAGIRCPSPTK